MLNLPEVRNVFSFIINLQRLAGLSEDALLRSDATVTGGGTTSQQILNHFHSEATKFLDTMKEVFIKKGLTAKADDAIYAPAAFINEIIRGSKWFTPPLKWPDLIDNIGGIEFYRKLYQIRQTPEMADVRNIYYKCLLLGFKGDPQAVEDQHKKINVAQIKAEMSNNINNMGASSKLTLEAKFTDKAIPPTPLWVWGVGVFLMMVLLGGLLFKRFFG
jgi:type VI protein secretion system component VasF